MIFTYTRMVEQATKRNTETKAAVTQAVQAFLTTDADKQENSADNLYRHHRAMVKYETPDGEICIEKFYLADFHNEECITVMFCTEY